MLGAGIGASLTQRDAFFLFEIFVGGEFCANIINLLLKIRHIKTKIIIGKCKISLFFVYIF